jgi:hypothetical protein
MGLSPLGKKRPITLMPTALAILMDNHQARQQDVRPPRVSDADATEQAPAILQLFTYQWRKKAARGGESLGMTRLTLWGRGRKLNSDFQLCNYGTVTYGKKGDKKGGATSAYAKGQTACEYPQAQSDGAPASRNRGLGRDVSRCDRGGPTRT